MTQTISPGAEALDPSGALAELLRAAADGTRTADEVLEAAVPILGGRGVVLIRDYRNFFSCADGCFHRLSYVDVDEASTLTLVRLDDLWAAAPRGDYSHPPFWFALFE